MSGESTIDVTLGPCDDMRAEVFVRPRQDGATGRRLVGTVTGPRRGREVTLPTTTRLVSLPDTAESGPLSRVILTEPAFWTPDLPNLYRVEARLEPGLDGFGVDTWIGLRRLGVRGRSFWFDGRRWVPRAVTRQMTAAAARQGAIGLVVESPSDELLASTDAIGVAVMAVLGRGEATPERIAALARHPSAVLVILPGDVVTDTAFTSLRQVKGTLQIGLAVDGGRPPPVLPQGTDFAAVVLAADGTPHDDWRRPPSTPLVAWRLGDGAGREACDALQRDLARWRLESVESRNGWDWAGYLAGEGLSGRMLR